MCHLFSSLIADYMYLFHNDILAIVRNMIVVGTRGIKRKNGFRGLLNYPDDNYPDTKVIPMEVVAFHCEYLVKSYTFKTFGEKFVVTFSICLK